MLLHRRYYKGYCVYTENSTEVLEKKVQGIYRFFVSYCGKTPALPDPSGQLQLFMTYHKSIYKLLNDLMAGFLQSQKMEDSTTRHQCTQ